MANERAQEKQGQIRSVEPISSRRDPEDRPVTEGGDRQRQLREKAFDKTLADSFPTSDPPSSIPDPSEADPYAA